jgi:uncharacterized 2Fe-2S/4Fe-4S cluster protein (DUF4445 family)
MGELTVRFEPEGQSVSVEEGALLAEAAAQVGIRLNRTCGGQGTCGRCEVVVRQGDVRPQRAATWSERAHRQGRAVRACQAVVASDLVVFVPHSSRVTDFAPPSLEILPEARREQFLVDGRTTPLARRLHAALALPSASDYASDLDRLRRYAREDCGLRADLDISLDQLRALPPTLRRHDFDVSLTVAEARGRCRVMEVGPVEPAPPWGLAVDVGTSTVVVELVSLEEGRAADVVTRRNGQTRYGADVISRIVWSEEHPHGLDDLRAAVLETINGLTAAVLRHEGVEADDIIAVSVAGNTTMMSFLLGIDARPIRRAPHVPPASALPMLTADELRLQVAPHAAVHVMPAVSGFVGGDISAGVLATGMAEDSEIRLLVDVGTNGEMVVGNREWLMCASCSAGPAFEGVGIEAAAHATRGAIESLDYDPATDKMLFETIGDSPPIGICGTGLVEALAALARAGLVDRAGQVNLDMASPRTRVRDDEAEVVLVWAEEAETNTDMCLRQSEIDNLMRSKAAVYAGITCMLRAVGLSVDDLAEVQLAGAFGNRLDVEKTVAIGMLPDLPRERIKFVGNTSLAGAYLALVSRVARETVADLAAKMTYRELGADLAFTEEFVAAMFLPHTDLARFPSCAREESA